MASGGRSGGSWVILVGDGKSHSIFFASAHCPIPSFHTKSLGSSRPSPARCLSCSADTGPRCCPAFEKNHCGGVASGCGELGGPCGLDIGCAGNSPFIFRDSTHWPIPSFHTRSLGCNWPEVANCLSCSEGIGPSCWPLFE